MACEAGARWLTSRVKPITQTPPDVWGAIKATQARVAPNLRSIIRCNALRLCLQPCPESLVQVVGRNSAGGSASHPEGGINQASPSLTIGGTALRSALRYIRGTWYLHDAGATGHTQGFICGTRCLNSIGKMVAVTCCCYYALQWRRCCWYILADVRSCVVCSLLRFLHPEQ